MAKHKFPEAEKRLFQRVFICMDCGSKIRSDAAKVKAGKINCRRCHGKNLRQKHKDRK